MTIITQWGTGAQTHTHTHRGTLCDVHHVTTPAVSQTAEEAAVYHMTETIGVLMKPGYDEKTEETLSWWRTKVQRSPLQWCHLKLLIDFLLLRLSLSVSLSQRFEVIYFFKKCVCVSHTSTRFSIISISNQCVWTFICFCWAKWQGSAFLGVSLFQKLHLTGWDTCRSLTSQCY